MPWPIVARMLSGRASPKASLFAFIGCMMLGACWSGPDLKFDDAGTTDGFCPSSPPSNASLCCNDVPCGGPGCSKSLCGICRDLCDGALCCVDGNSQLTCASINGSCPN